MVSLLYLLLLLMFKKPFMHHIVKNKNIGEAIVVSYFRFLEQHLRLQTVLTVKFFKHPLFKG